MILSQRRDHRLLLAAIVAAVVVVAVLILLREGTHPAQPEVVVPSRIDSITTTEDGPPYPDSWLASAADVKSASVAAILPNAPEANGANASAYYVWPNGQSVAAIYPLSSAPTSDVRQNYIEVWAGEWTRGDPETVLPESLASFNIDGATMIEVGGTPVASVPAHSSTDPERRNPAVLWFVVKGIEYQVSGGDHSADLTSIAKDIITRAS